jgi:hypothetical protein
MGSQTNLRTVHQTLVTSLLLGGLVLAAGCPPAEPAKKEPEGFLVYRPARVGDRIQSKSVTTARDLAVSMRMKNATTKAQRAQAAKVDAMTGTATIESHIDDEEEVRQVKDGKATEVRSITTRSETAQKLAIGATKEDTTVKGPLVGSPVIAELQNGIWRRRLESGVPNDEQKAALTDRPDSRSAWPTGRVKMGERWMYEDKTMMSLADGRATHEVTVTGNATYNGEPVVVVAHTLTVDGKSDEGHRMVGTLKGEGFFSAKDGRELYMKVAGDMEMTADQGALEFKMKGPMTIETTWTMLNEGR